MLLGEVVDQLHDDDGLADAGAAEEADLSALHVRLEEVDDLDAGLEELVGGGLLRELRRRTMDLPELLRFDRRAAIDRFADDVHDAAERFLADRDADAVARVADFHAADESVGGVHRDAAHGVLTEVLRHFDDEVFLPRVDGRVGDPERAIDRGELAGLKLDVDDRSDDLRDASDAECVRRHSLILPKLPCPRRSPSIPW